MELLSIYSVQHRLYIY